eukprot:1992416-Rhodomonas_salina.2
MSASIHISAATSQHLGHNTSQAQDMTSTTHHKKHLDNAVHKPEVIVGQPTPLWSKQEPSLRSLPRRYLHSIFRRCRCADHLRDKRAYSGGRCVDPAARYAASVPRDLPAYA